MSDRNYWLEITRRPDIGTNLYAPAGDKNGEANWSYELIHAIEPGDGVYHYDSVRGEIVGVSTAVGRPWSDTVFWAGRGTRSRNIAPHVQAGWYLGLEDYSPLRQPLTKAELTRKRRELMALRQRLRVSLRGPVHFPFIPYGPQEVRAYQAYLTPFPQELFGLFPELLLIEEKAADLAAIGATYRPADEQTAVGSRDPFEIDPALVERGLRGHARTQNALAAAVLVLGAEPLSPKRGEPNFDLAWRLDGVVHVAEIKSRTDENEEGQLRLGLGQILRYRHQLERLLGEEVRAVIALESEPRDRTWEPICTQLGVRLCWAPDFNEIENGMPISTARIG